MSNDDYIEITASIEHETDAAWLIDDGGKQVWVPRSLINEAEVEVEGRGSNGKDVYTIPIQEWFAKQEGLI